MTLTIASSRSRAIEDLKAEYGASLEKISPNEKRVLAVTLLTFLEDPESNIYDVLEDCDPDCILGEQLGWFHLIKISMGPRRSADTFARELLAESTPSAVQVCHLN